jgi:hypothetical protein
MQTQLAMKVGHRRRHLRPHVRHGRQRRVPASSAAISQVVAQVAPLAVFHDELHGHALHAYSQKPDKVRVAHDSQQARLQQRLHRCLVLITPSRGPDHLDRDLTPAIACPNGAVIHGRQLFRGHSGGRCELSQDHPTVKPFAQHRASRGEGGKIKGMGVKGSIARLGRPKQTSITQVKLLSGLWAESGGEERERMSNIFQKRNNKRGEEAIA